MATNDELKEALDEYVLQNASRLGPRCGPLAKLLEHLVNRAIETGQVFNSHTHPVSVDLRGDDYYTSAGNGHTSEPAKAGAYGCDSPIRIGEKKRNDDDDDD